MSFENLKNHLYDLFTMTLERIQLLYVNPGSLSIYYSPREGCTVLQSACLSVCLSVCPPACISQKKETVVQPHEIFYTSAVRAAVVLSFFANIAARCVLPILWTTSFLHNGAYTDITSHANNRV